MVKEGEGVKCIVMVKELTLGGEQTVQHVDDVL